MLSILIPIFNWDVRALVSALQQQATNTGIAFEIRCLDDCSQQRYQLLNREIAQWSSVVYEELPQNVGRAAIRNHLGQAAQFPFLLFMDCDSGIIRSDYLATYIRQLDPQAVLVGGTAYSQIPPQDASQYLRWLYGTKRESRSVQTRQQHPWGNFTTHHFIIPKSVFLEHPFSTAIKAYGHEDTLFGQSLQEAGVRVVHLNNPLEHLGLDAAPVFLDKVNQSVQTLLDLEHNGIRVSTRLTTSIRVLEQWHVASLFSVILSSLNRLFIQNLLSPNPKLWILDLYKLGRYLQGR